MLPVLCMLPMLRVLPALPSLHVPQPAPTLAGTAGC